MTIPNHNPLCVGTLAAIIADIATHIATRHRLDRDQLVKTLFGWRRTCGRSLANGTLRVPKPFFFLSLHRSSLNLVDRVK